jgi:hypothetical protein
MAEITLEMLQASKVRQTMHFDGPRGKDGFFGYMYAGIEYPRMQRKVTYWRANRGTTVEWYVDGAKVGDNLADALPALNQPPVLTEAESAALALFGEDWQPWKGMDIPYEVVRALGDKGMIEAERGQMRRRQEVTHD